MSEHPEVVHERARQRFVLVVDDDVVAVADYVDHEGRRTFTHTVVPPRLEGRGYATRLVDAAVRSTEEAGLEPVGACSFVASHLSRRSTGTGT